YDTSNDVLTVRSVDNCEGGTELLDTTFGLRAGGSLDNGPDKIVILAGPSILSEGVNMFAFDPETKLCVAAKHFPEYNDSRKMLTVDGVLYFAISNTPVDPSSDFSTGRVLRYRGDSEDPL
ncbi:hypothetical protein MYX76_18860, partial [Desulfobacterota bacterium AH_259_B03_O07]|nr:hypothetical protein [Desulfobacterota bacterium AH_259_B03_O07]